MIPPAVIEIRGDDRSLLDTVAEVKAVLRDLASNVTNVPIGGDLARLVAAIGEAKGMTADYAAQVTDTQLGADDSALISKLAQARAALLALAKSATTIDPKMDLTQITGQIAQLKTLLSDENLDLDLDIKPALLELAELKGDVAMMKLDDVIVKLDTRGALAQATTLQQTIDKLTADITIGADVNNAELAAKLASVDATIALAKADLAVTPTAAGGGGGRGALLAALGFGTSGLPFLGGLAGMGTIGSLAGFGPEHAIGVGAGLAGFAGAGLAGGGLLAAGTAGVAGVGIGTDLAGIGQAAGDIKNVTTALTALDQVGGKTAANQLALNQALSSFSPVARSAVLAAAQTAEGFKAMFDKLTGPAEKVGAQIIQQVMQVGEKFLPTIGAFALKNTEMIKKDIQPLFAWLQSGGPQGGLGIFTNLEKIFSAELPTAIHAGTQAFELFARVINMAAGYTGQFLPKLDAFLTRWNSFKTIDFGGKAEGLPVLAKDVGKLIGDFRDWEALAKAIGRAITGLFTPMAGTAKDIVKTMTQMVDKFDAWERTGSGISRLTDLFQAHKREIDQILKLLPGLISAFGGIELTAGPVLTNLASDLLAVINFLERIPGVGKILEIGAALAIFASRMKVLGGLGALFSGAGEKATAFERVMGSLGKATGIQSLVTWLSNGAQAAGRFAVGALTLATSEEGVTAATGGMRIAMIGLQSVGLLVVAAGVYELIKHFGVLRGLMIAAVPAIALIAAALMGLDGIPVVALVVAIGLAIAGLVAGIIELVKHWSTVWGEIKKLTGDAVNFLKAHLSLFAEALGTIMFGPMGTLVAYMATHWNTVKSDAVTAWNAVISFLKRAGSDIVGAFKGAGRWLLQVGKDIIMGLVHGIEGAYDTAKNAVTRLGKDVVGWAKDALHVFSPSQDFIEIGQYVVKGLAQGVGDSGEASAVQSVLLDLANRMIATFRSLIPEFTTAGTQMMQGLILGISSEAAAVAKEAVSAATGALSAAKSATKTNSPSQAYAELGANWILGAIQGVHSQAGALKSTVSSTVTSALPSAGLGVGGRGAGFGSGGITVTYGNITITSPSGTTPDLSASLQRALQQNTEQLLTSLHGVGAGQANG